MGWRGDGGDDGAVVASSQAASAVDAPSGVPSAATVALVSVQATSGVFYYHKGRLIRPLELSMQQMGFAGAARCELSSLHLGALSAAAAAANPEVDGSRLACAAGAALTTKYRFTTFGYGLIGVCRSRACACACLLRGSHSQATAWQ